METRMQRRAHRGNRLACNDAEVISALNASGGNSRSAARALGYTHDTLQIYDHADHADDADFARIWLFCEGYC